MFCPEGKRRGEQKKSLETPLNFFSAYTVLGFWDHFELYAIIVKKLASAHFSEQFLEILKKNS
jgi:hypothetical protein